jgi:geranylgeranyl diphosphate synthase, type I
MNFIDQLKEYKEVSNKKLEMFLRLKAKHSFSSEFLKDLIDKVILYNSRGGKSIRSSLLYYTYVMLSNNHKSEFIGVSNFLELLQAYLLIHDDIIDNDEYRRGDKAFHISYSKYAKDNSYSDPEWFGIQVGIIAGDLLNNLAMELILENEFLSEFEKIQILKIVAEGFNLTAEGELLDVIAPNQPVEDAYELSTIASLKTAHYTFVIPMQIGALLAGKYFELKDTLREIGLQIGNGYQLKDDILGIFGDSEVTGKSNQSDINEGKKTMLYHHTTKNLKEDQLTKFNNLYGRKDLTIDEVDSVRNFILGSGAKEIVEGIVRNQLGSAKSLLKKLISKENEGYYFIDDMISYIEKRVK